MKSHIKEIINIAQHLALINHTELRVDIVKQLLEPYKNNDGVLYLIKETLLSEKTKSYFEPAHFERTYRQKQQFNYEISTLISKILGEIYAKYDFTELSAPLQSFDENKAKNAISELEMKGYWIADTQLAHDFIDRIITGLSSPKFRQRKSGKAVNGFYQEKALNITESTCWIESQQEILKIPEVQQLIMDPTFLTIIQEYLGCPPIHCQSNCWWTINCDNDAHALSRNAQMFHQDKEFIKFIKLFLYLNDVDENNGPHSYVEGSFKDYEQHVSEDYQISSRMSDDEMLKRYGKEKIVSLTGKRGTIILEDTSGFHKGVPVQKGYRLLLQLEFCCSMYFNPVDSFTLQGLPKDYSDLAEKYPRLFLNYNHQRFLSHQKRKAKSLRKIKRRHLIRSTAKKVIPKSILEKIRH